MHHMLMIAWLRCTWNDNVRPKNNAHEELKGSLYINKDQLLHTKSIHQYCDNTEHWLITPRPNAIPTKRITLSNTDALARKNGVLFAESWSSRIYTMVMRLIVTFECSQKDSQSFICLYKYTASQKRAWILYSKAYWIDTRRYWSSLVFCIQLQSDYISL